MVTQVSEGSSSRGGARDGFSPRNFHATVCIQLSMRSGNGRSTSSLRGRVTLLRSCLRDRPGLGLIRVCSSGKFANASFSEPTFAQLFTSMRGKHVGYVIMGSFSELKQGCVRAKRCLRGVFPFLKIHFVSIGSNCSDASTGTNTLLTTSLGGLVGSVCTGSVSGGVYSAVGSGHIHKSCVNGCTPCKCLGSRRGGGGLIISPRVTPVIIRVFRLHTGNAKVTTVYHVLGRGKCPSPNELHCRHKVVAGGGGGKDTLP